MFLFYVFDNIQIILMYQEVSSWDQNDLSRAEITQITELRSNAFFARELFPVGHGSSNRHHRRSNSVPQTRLRQTKFTDSRPYNNAPIQRQLFPKKKEQTEPQNPQTKLKRPDQNDRPRII